MKLRIAAALVATQMISMLAFADGVEVKATGIGCVQPFPMETVLQTIRYAVDDAENDLKHQCKEFGGTLVFRSQKIIEFSAAERCVHLTVTQQCHRETAP